MKLTQDQINILSKCEIKENKIYLKGELDRKQYLNINEVLETIGAKWSRKEKAHIAEWLTEEDLENALSDVIETGEVETLKDTIKKFQFYPTPKEVAEYLVELADIQEDETVFEPSAGDGAIVKVILEQNPAHLFKLIANELEVNRYNELKQISGINNLYNEDFLEYSNKTFDKIIANPPFSKSQDVKHILHMYELLNKGGRIVSVASSSTQTRTGKLYDELRALNPEFIDLQKGSFKASGTMVNSCIVIINKPL